MSMLRAIRIEDTLPKHELHQLHGLAAWRYHPGNSPGLRFDIKRIHKERVLQPC